MSEKQFNGYDRETAFETLREYVKADSLIKHSLTVEAVMRHFSGIYQEDPDVWGVTGLLHDIDFELYPEQHCHKTREILAPLGWPEETIRAIESHGYQLVNDVEPKTNLEKVLYTVDELTGLIAATTILRPSRSLFDLEVKSVKKKWKQKSFAEGVNREVIAGGAEKLGMPLEKVIEETILGMRDAADEIGLRGDIQAAQAQS